ncbi:hypothetical protein AIOL_004173 [Candidatus Rhodobacter oscarellae]|uniref:DUF6455 domain-containing protein n=1 Tax=Candidatus Rhodobacter oscarellae TaxID=1675527 RepID=A0A0J9E8T7_9RHOB|nr:DUF6455 family protein [Candidatus Rhodobacter lobularis]KMW59192.1 hypothetical protein AIOL_004173 [Candidatus Rhodobacter lobularis]
MGIFEKLATYLAQRRELGELDAMADTELSDLALEPHALRQTILARPQLRRQVLGMAEKFGLTDEDISHPHWREMEILERCQNCDRPRACRWYLSGRATEFGPQHCPNAATYGEIAREKGAG